MTTVLFNTLYKNPADGWAIASRAFARAMDMAGLRVHLHDWRDRYKELEPEVKEEVGRFDVFTRSWDLHVFSSMLGTSEQMWPALRGVLLQPGANAFYCVFERRSLDAGMAALLNKFAGVWVQCRMNQQVLEDAGVVNATLIHPPFFADDPLLRIEPARESTRFYYIGKFEPRKDPANVIRAFMRAFKPGEAHLTIKTSPIAAVASDYPNPYEVILEELVDNTYWNVRNWRDSIQVITAKLGAEEMVELHAANDVYVSASHGEGLDLPAFAAKLAGRRVITAPSGGPEDFLDPDVDVVLPQTGLVPAHPCYKWGEGATLAGYDVDDLVAAMRRVRREQVRGTRTWPGQDNFRAERVGSNLREWVEGCLEARQNTLRGMLSAKAV